MIRRLSMWMLKQRIHWPSRSTSPPSAKLDRINESAHTHCSLLPSHFVFLINWLIDWKKDNGLLAAAAVAKKKEHQSSDIINYSIQLSDSNVSEKVSQRVLKWIFVDSLWEAHTRPSWCEIQVRLENNDEEDRISHTRHFYDLFDVYFGARAASLSAPPHKPQSQSARFKRISSTSH
jgi:hypothetical protein